MVRSMQKIKIVVVQQKWNGCIRWIGQGSWHLGCNLRGGEFAI